MSIILWLVIVNIAVFIHELAHYAAARMQGVNVRAFSIGMGPILWRKPWRGTEWRVSALPIGGYVDIEGMGATPGPDGQLIEPTSGMAKLPYLGKVWVLFAGPLSNVILAIVLVAAGLIFQGVPKVQPGPVALERVVFNSPAEKAGLKPGDTILAVDGKPVTEPSIVRAALQENGDHVFTIRRGTQRTDLPFTWKPQVAEGECRPLFGLQFNRPTITYERRSPGTALVESTASLLGGIPETVNGIGVGLFRTFTFARQTPCSQNDIVGPIGVIGIVGQVAQQGFWALLQLAAIINLSLGVFNLIPIPGLDGGRILVATIIAIRRRPFAPGQEEFVNFIGFAFVLVFMGLVLFRDITRVIGG